MRNQNPNFSAKRTRERLERSYAGGDGRSSNRNHRRNGHKPATIWDYIAQGVVSCVFLAFLVWYMAPDIRSAAALAALSPEERAARESSVYYPGCNEPRAAGITPIYRGQPGYREGMDGDGDGIACE